MTDRGTASARPSSFEDLFGRRPEISASAPGRVNLIGEHTDYNDGFVLPVAIRQRTRVQLAIRQDRSVRAWSANVAHGANAASYRLGEEAPGLGWLDYLQGITREIAARGYALTGCDVRIETDVPIGGGLGSSAALEISFTRALRVAFALPLDDVAIAIVGQRAECEFVGAPVGVMDQMVSSLGDEDAALFLDTRSLECDRIPLPPDSELAVIDSGVAHNHAAGSYRVRRAECERAAVLLGVRALRDLTPDDLPRIAALPSPLDRRTLHVVTENGRVEQAVLALREGDLPAIGRLFYESHASMRDDFEVSTPEIDLLVELAREERAVYGARLTGGGFGGSIVLIAARGEARRAADRIARRYDDRSHLRSVVVVPPPLTS